jgi:putative nucleotidyltransferase-like protein
MWPETISEEQWSVYQRVIARSRAAGLRFAVGGGLAVGVYTDHWRESKDIDFYVLPKDREIMQRVLTEAGLVDYYDQLPYDRAWIYRSVQGKIIVDVIWSMANHKIDVDERWILCGPEVTIRGETIRIVPPEEMIWAKLYVLQHDRTDWPDVLNMLYAQCEKLDWSHLLKRLGEDAALLYAILTIFRWLCPNLAQELPAWLWQEAEKPGVPQSFSQEDCRRRADLLDRRRWFSPVIST